MDTDLLKMQLDSESEGRNSINSVSESRIPELGGYIFNSVQELFLSII